MEQAGEARISSLSLADISSSCPTDMCVRACVCVCVCVGACVSASTHTHACVLELSASLSRFFMTMIPSSCFLVQFIMG